MKTIITALTIVLGLSLNAQIYINNAPSEASKSKSENFNGGIIVNVIVLVKEKAVEDIKASSENVVEESNKTITNTTNTVKQETEKIVEEVKETISQTIATSTTTKPLPLVDQTSTSLRNTAYSSKSPRVYIRKKIEAQYETVYETVQVSQEVTKTVTQTPKTIETTEKVMLTPATKKWVKTGVKEECTSPNPKDCEILALVETPAVYKTVKKELKSGNTSSKTVITQPKVFKVVKKEILVSPERYEDVLLEDNSSKIGSYNNSPISTTSKTVTTTVKPTKYVPLNTNNLTSSNIMEIQRSLNSIGYYNGTIDGKLNNETRKAISSFQTDNGISNKSINNQTLNLLGIY